MFGTDSPTDRWYSLRHYISHVRSSRLIRRICGGIFCYPRQTSHTHMYAIYHFSRGSIHAKKNLRFSRNFEGRPFRKPKQFGLTKNVWKILTFFRHRKLVNTSLNFQQFSAVILHSCRSCGRLAQLAALCVLRTAVPLLFSSSGR